MELRQNVVNFFNKICKVLLSACVLLNIINAPCIAYSDNFQSSLQPTSHTIEIDKIKNFVKEETDIINIQNIDEESKKSALQTLNDISADLNRLGKLDTDEAKFDKLVANAPLLLPKLEAELNSANSEFTKPIPDVSSYDNDKISELLNTLLLHQKTIQDNLSLANSDLINLQALPSKAQETISKNSNYINTLSLLLSGNPLDIGDINSSSSTSNDSNKSTTDAKTTVTSPALASISSISTTSASTGPQTSTATDIIIANLSSQRTPLTEAQRVLIELHIYILERENLFLQKQLTAQNSMQDIANYKIKIFSLENKYYTDYIRAVQTRQNELISEGLINDSPYPNEELLQIPEIKALVDENQKIISYIDSQLKDNVKMSQESLDVENALVEVKQIEKNLQDQLKELKGSLILSRLLNRQQSEIPDVSISFNLDELIPNLNIWMYDLRSYRDRIFDTKSFVSNLIKSKPHLAIHADEIENIIRHRRSLYDQLYQGLSDAQTKAISLKLHYSEYLEIKDRVNAVINEHLFWLASNLPLGKDFLFAFMPNLQLQIKGFTNSISSEGFIPHFLTLFIPIALPLALLGVILKLLSKVFIRFDNKLALRLDKPSDGFLVTPLALINKIIQVIPRASLLIIAGAIIIFLALDQDASHHTVLLMLSLHVLAFMFFLEVLKPNSLSQRHFSTPPNKVAYQRAFFDQVWFAVIPVLIIANVREIEPIKITGDVIGYCIVLLCCVYLTYIIIKTLKNKFDNENLQMTDWLKGLCAIAVPLTLIIMLSLGYYYTAVKLINRVAYTFYICMLYILVSSLIHRELYVAEIRLIRNSKLANLNAKISKAEAEGNNNTIEAKGNKSKSSFSNSLTSIAGRFNKINGKANTAQSVTTSRQKIEQLRFELINTKAFKLINIILLVGTAYLLYLQWNDLAGVLSYLDTITLWSSKTLVDGKMIETSVLTLADVFTAGLILVVAVILNRNLPALLERLFLLKFSAGHKSTSYTVKIITSYIITALGIIFAAGAIGISWDNLQWLVAALSVGLGFGLQEIFANFVSGLIILFERQIRVGDIITLNNLSGTVNKIRIRSTTIISFDNKEVMIPNREFITSALTNWSLSNTITMLEFSVGIAYDADSNKAKQILSSIVKGCKNLVPEKPPKIYIKSLDESCVTIMCEVYVNEIGNRKPTYDYLSTQTLTRFAKEGIEIPFNQLDVKIKE